MIPFLDGLGRDLEERYSWEVDNIGEDETPDLLQCCKKTFFSEAAARPDLI